MIFGALQSWILGSRNLDLAAAMESLRSLMYLLELPSLILITTAVFVTFGSAYRALGHGKEPRFLRSIHHPRPLPSAHDPPHQLPQPFAHVFISWPPSHCLHGGCLGLVALLLFIPICCLHLLVVCTGIVAAWLEMITKKLELPVKLIFPRDLIGGMFPGSNNMDYMMLGLGDMAIPAMLVALVLTFDHQKRGEASPLNTSSSRRPKYVWYEHSGYAIGLVTALGAGILYQSPQPALIYLDQQVTEDIALAVIDMYPTLCH